MYFGPLSSYHLHHFDSLKNADQYFEPVTWKSKEILNTHKKAMK